MVLTWFSKYSVVCVVCCVYFETIRYMGSCVWDGTEQHTKQSRTTTTATDQREKWTGGLNWNWNWMLYATQQKRKTAEAKPHRTIHQPKPPFILNRPVFLFAGLFRAPTPTCDLYLLSSLLLFGYSSHVNFRFEMSWAFAPVGYHTCSVRTFNSVWIRHRVIYILLCLIRTLTTQLFCCIK